MPLLVTNSPCDEFTGSPIFGPCLLWPRSSISAIAELLFGVPTQGYQQLLSSCTTVAQKLRLCLHVGNPTCRKKEHNVGTSGTRRPAKRSWMSGTIFIHKMATSNSTKVLSLTSQTKLTLTLTLILTLTSAALQTLLNRNICMHIVDTHNFVSDL